jgi:WD40 repeat protein
MALAFDAHEPHQLFSGGYDNVIKLWNYQSKQCIKQFIGHSKIVFCLLVLPDVIVSASREYAYPCH